MDNETFDINIFFKEFQNSFHKIEKEERVIRFNENSENSNETSDFTFWIKIAMYNVAKEIKHQNKGQGWNISAERSLNKFDSRKNRIDFTLYRKDTGMIDVEHENAVDPKSYRTELKNLIISKATFKVLITYYSQNYSGCYSADEFVNRISEIFNKVLENLKKENNKSYEADNIYLFYAKINGEIGNFQSKKYDKNKQCFV